VQPDEQARIPPADVFLADNLVITKVIDAKTAVFLVYLHQQQTLFAGFEVDLAVHLPLLTPLIDMRAHLVLEKPPHGLPEHIVLFFEDSAFHNRFLRYR
jgi:hypothetical protein